MSRKEAINAKCNECIYEKDDKGIARQQIAMCTSYTCPLNDLRPLPIYQRIQYLAKAK